MFNDELLESMEAKRKFRGPPPGSDCDESDSDTEEEIQIIAKEKMNFPYNIIPDIEEMLLELSGLSDWSDVEFSDTSEEQKSGLVTVKKEIPCNESQSKHVKSRKELEISTVARPKKKSKYKTEPNSSDNSDYGSSYVSAKRKRNVNLSICRTEDSESDYDSYQENRLSSRYELQTQPDDLGTLGYYYCRDCHASMNSKSTWISHLNGKRHMKNVKQSYVSKAALETISGEVPNRYPLPMPGYTRVKTDEEAHIQRSVKNNVKPCLGLENVVEIRGIEDISYYCGLCDAPCSQDTIIPHLQGYKHQLNCLKEIQPELYEAYRYRKKSEVERKIFKVLMKEQKKRRQAKILVEKDVPHDRSLPSTSHSFASSCAVKEELKDTATWSDFIPTIAPDTSKSDYYCPTCDSHMNSVNMWEAHVRGKRHQKNLKKCPGEVPSKVKSLPSPYSRPILNLDHEEGPIVGLDYIRENQNPETGETYHCYLCRANSTPYDIVEHLLTPKHMRKYLEKIEEPSLKSIVDLPLSVSSQNDLIIDVCRRVERERGRGNMEIYVAKCPYPFMHPGSRK